MMYKRFVTNLRRKMVKMFAGQELVRGAESVDGLRLTIERLVNQVDDLRQQAHEHEHNLVKYMHPDKYEEWLKDKFFQLYKKELDFDNLNTFTEKMQWIKLYGSDETQTELADKYLVKEYVKQMIGEKHVVPLIGVYDSFDEIDFSKLPKRFVIKANNSSSSNIIVNDKNNLNINEVRAKVEGWTRRNLFTYGLEMHYKNIKPKIIIEKYIEFKNGVEDYKFYCFNGKPEYLLVIADRFTDEKMAFYDMKFRRQNFSILPGMKDLNIAKPKQFKEMLDLTKLLLEKLDYPFVRVDWYIDKKGNLYFGEFTFNPGAGWYFFNPGKYDEIWGSKITLPQVRNEIP